VGLASGTAVMGVDFILQALGNKDEPLKVLVLGGAGGVGSAAICYLHALGHTVWTTCSERNTEWCRKMGADHLVDYQKQNWWEEVPSGELDGVFQAVGMEGDFEKAEAVLKKGGAFATCDRGGGGIIGALLSGVWRKLTSSIHYSYFLNKPSTANLSTVARLMEEGKWTSNLGHTFSFEEAKEAYDLSRSKKATGKIVINVSIE
jgi:NADPH:quinone reductase-like Zn-dependent oxidoreductase